MAESAGLERLKQAQRLFGEGLLDDPRTLDHLNAAISSGCVEGEDLGFAQWMLATCEKVRGDFEKQQAALDIAVTLLPVESELGISARSDLANLLVSEGRFAEAEQVLRDLLSVDRSHAFASDWMVLLATCIVDGQPDPNLERLNAAVSLLDEAFAVLTMDDQQTTEFPYELALLQCMTTRALCKAKLPEWSTRWEAISEFEVAEKFGRDNLGPYVGVDDLIPLYRGWTVAYEALGLAEEAVRVAEHGRRIVGRAF